MTAAYDYIGRRHAQAHAEGIELDRVNADIAGMQAQMEKLTSNLAAAKQYAGVLTTSILMAQQLVEDECKRNDWPTPEDPEVEPVPSPIERSARVSVDTGPDRTQAFEAFIPCRHCGAPIHEVFAKDTGEFWAWTHIHQDLVACNLVVPGAGDTHAEPPAPALQEGMHGDPTRLTVIQPHGVGVADHG